jgi:hypothetical protein
LLLYEIPNRAEDVPRLRRPPKPTGASTSPQIKDWNALQRQAYGLTQVSNLIRKELLPLYREEVAVRIDIHDLPHYVTDVILSNNKHLSLVYGNINIDVKYDCSVDLRDTILLHDRAPNLQLKFTHPGGQDNDMMSILLDADHWPKFHAYISERTSRVVLDFWISDALIFCPGPVDESDLEDDWDPPLLTWPYAFDTGYFTYVKGLLHIKEECAEPWMLKPTSTARHWRDGLAGWEEELGLGGLTHSRYSFRPQV